LNIPKYREAERDLPLNPFYATLAPLLPPGGQALDLGCGIGKGSRFLAERGFSVLAIDRDPEMIRVARELTDGAIPIRYEVADMASYAFPPSDLVTAVFCLFFLSQPDLLATLDRVVRCLRPGGIFAGQILGPNDTWAETGASTISRPDLELSLRQLDFLKLQEVDRLGKTVWGDPKHWHVFHVIARQPTD